MARRTFLAAGTAGILALAAAGCSGASGPSPAARRWRMPDEGAPHAATWMAFGVQDAIWTPALAADVRAVLHDVASVIAEFEPVIALVPPGSSDAHGVRGVELVERAHDDLWIRDTGPTFVRSEGALAGVDGNFDGWGGKQRHDLDAEVARVVCEEAGVARRTTDLVFEGGAIEVDGEGTAIVTESCMLDARNPGWTKREIERELDRLLGIERVIWLPGIAGMDITDGHTDFYARFASPGVVIAARDDDPASFDHAVTREHLEILATATDVRGRPLDVRVLPGPSTIRPTYADDDFAAGYVNFLVCDGAVIAPEFGDRDADAFAFDTLAELFPGREVVQLDIDPLAAGGGGIHCATQQQPLAEEERS